MNPHDELHVLADAADLVPADLDEGLALKEPHRARDDQVPAEAVEGEPSEQERAQVLEHLQPHDHQPRNRDGADLAVADLRAVDDPHGPPGDEHAPIAVDEGLDEMHERAGVEHRVCIHATDQRCAAEVDARV